MTRSHTRRRRANQWARGYWPFVPLVTLADALGQAHQPRPVSAKDKKRLHEMIKTRLGEINKYETPLIKELLK